MHNVTVVRSVTHKYPLHGVAYATTAIPEIDARSNSPRTTAGTGRSSAPRCRTWNSGRAPPPRRSRCRTTSPCRFRSAASAPARCSGPGRTPAFLGNQFAPHFTSFHGTATAKITKTLTDRTVEFDEPYAGTSHDSYFALGGEPAADLTLDRMNTRKSLLDQMEDARTHARGIGLRLATPFREMAYSLIGSNAVRHALDVRREPAKTRESYGHMLFGQSCLAARRLVEAGSRFVTVFWDEFGLAGSGWDTHWEHYPRMRNELMPGFDRGFSGLISDLDQRGMLDETLVMVLSEHGRTPKLNSAKGAGRDHWAQAYSVLLAGGGIARGKTVGKTDSIGGTVADRPVSPKDVLATAYHLLGYDLETTLTDRTGRPVPIMPGGQVLRDVLA